MYEALQHTNIHTASSCLTCRALMQLAHIYGTVKCTCVFCVHACVLILVIYYLQYTSECIIIALLCQHCTLHLGCRLCASRKVRQFANQLMLSTQSRDASSLRLTEGRHHFTHSKKYKFFSTTHSCKASPWTPVYWCQMYKTFFQAERVASWTLASRLMSSISSKLCLMGDDSNWLQDDTITITKVKAM